MAGRQLRAVVVGASSILGKELIEELNSSPAAAWDIRLLDERDEGEMQISAAGEEAVLIQPLNAESLDGADLIFFAGDPASTREYSPLARRRGAAVVDLTYAMEGEAGFVLRSPWLGDSVRPDLETAGVVAAHPAALMLAVICDRLQRRMGLEHFTATVLEPASQAGRAGVDELHQQTVSLLSFQSVPKEIYDTQVAFTLQNRVGENAKVTPEVTLARIQRQLPALLGTDIAAKIRFNVVQAPVFHGYTVSGYADLSRSATPAEVLDGLNGGVIVAEADTNPSNIAVTDTGDLLVSAGGKANAPSAGVWLWMAADNLRFMARNAVAAGLELAALRPTDRVQ